MTRQAVQTPSAGTLLGEAANEYSDRIHCGERPSIEEYVHRYPQIAAEIREVFPALDLMRDSCSSGVEERIPRDATTEQQCLGDFRILREIGRGGMGIVYEAVQASLGRPVALKVLPFAGMLDDKQLQRFKNEARAAAALDHPNIVPIHFVGSDRGVHYYAMHLVEGHSLADVIEELRLAEATDRSGDSIHSLDSRAEMLTVASPGGDDPTISKNAAHCQVNPALLCLSEAPTKTGWAALTNKTAATGNSGQAFFNNVARVGAQAAEALEHAHSLGVIHRDIKPANLMLDATGKLWITDFGLARMESETGITMTGDFLGTLRYMAPEQALAKPLTIDHRVDIYALGVTLYELLTLRPVFDGTDREKLLKQIAFDEPTAPRKCVQRIPLDLDTIVLKALAKDRDDRYETAAEMAEDLGAFLEHRPLKARPPTLPERLSKWSRRHQLLVWTSVVILFFTCAGLSIAAALIAHQRDRAHQQSLRAEEHRQRAESNLGRTLLSVSAMLARLNDENLSDNPEMEALRDDMFEHVETFYSSLIAEDLADIDSAMQAGGAYIHLGRLYAGQGRDHDADAAYAAAVTIAARLVEQFPLDHRRWVDLGTAKVIMGEHLQARGQFSRSKIELRGARDAFHRAVLLRPDDPAALENYAFFLNSCADPHVGDAEVALQLAREAVILDPDGPRWGTLGMAHFRLGQWKLAAYCLEKSLARHDTPGDVHWHDKKSEMFALPIAYWEMGQIDRALICYEQAADWVDRYVPGPPLSLRVEAELLMGIRNGPGAAP